MAEGTRIRDPVHNFIELTEEELKLLATPLVQRLRRIRQLAMAHLVYPGALHTRFDHTLGVCHVAGLMARKLGLDRHEERLIRLATILHDLGHGPFSHVSETILERYADPEAIPANQKKEKIHELITAHLIITSQPILDLLGKDTCKQIVKLLSKGHGQPVLKSIVSGPLDADKQDYLLRDSYFCGVPYGVFDIHQLHRSFVLAGPEDEKALAISPDGVPALEQYVLAKYYLTMNVYRHQVRLITDQMIVRAIVLGIDEDNNEDLRLLYTFDDTSDFYARYVRWDDSLLTSAFVSNDSKTLCGEILGKLRERRLHKQVYSERLQDLPDPKIRDKLLEINRLSNSVLRGQIENALAELLKEHLGVTIDRRLVILNGFNIQSVRASSKNDESSMIIAAAPEPKPFEEFSPLFASIKEGYANGSVEVYAPLEWETRADRKKIRDKLREPIRQTVERFTKETIIEEEAKA